MSRSKERNKDEWYKGRIRQLESQVRRLEKQLKYAEKQSLYVSDLESVIEEETAKIKKCPQCLTGVIQEIDLGIKLLDKCNSCDYKKTKEKQ